MAVIACAGVVSANCSSSEYLVTAGHPTAQATTDEVERCTALHQVKSAEEDKSSPPVNIRAVVGGSKADAEEVAGCLRDLSYQPITVKKR